MFVGSPKELDAELIRKERFLFETVSQKPFPSNFFSLLPFAWHSLRSVGEAFPIVRSFSPDLILGMGGFSSVPVVLAGWLRRIPTVLFEPNLYPGKANRFLSWFATRIAVGFKPEKSFFSPKKMVCVGVPVRQAIASLSLRPSMNGSFTLLVMGGSRGAQGLNQAFLNAYSLLKKEISELKLIHLTGKDLFEGVLREYRKKGVDKEVEVYPFVSDIARLMGASHLVVARSGASSLAEFAASGLPSILVPYPHSTQDHQIHNARYFERHGAAKMILEKDLSSDVLLKTILALKRAPAQLNKMSAAARQLAVHDAALNLLNLLYDK
jgi:UDP-N-acetylglucosamine--N-acetylmuramyl-(pentapeptide) pyrophosphoryl-undecaprenol N-acetylglucosamine transferase